MKRRNSLSNILHPAEDHISLHENLRLVRYWLMEGDRD